MRFSCLCDQIQKREEVRARKMMEDDFINKVKLEEVKTTSQKIQREQERLSKQSETKGVYVTDVAGEMVKKVGEVPANAEVFWKPVRVSQRRRRRR